MNSQKQRAIVLDDDECIRLLLEYILKRCGYSVVTYKSPNEETIYKHPESCPALSGHRELFDDSPACAELMITDINMPHVGGFEYVRKLRQAGCGVRHIAMISGAWTANMKAEAAELGCKVFVKPFTASSVSEWIDVLENEG